MGKWLMTLIYLAVSVFLTRLIPFSSFFRNLDTMMHEFCHALIALLLSGQVLGIELHSDHSGVTYTRLASSWSSLPVSMSGYIGASVFSLLLFALHRRRAQRLGLALIVAVAAVMLILFVHGGFGMAWLAIFIALTGTMLFLGPKIRNFYYLLLAFLTLEESALGPISLALIALGSPSRAGDATNLANETGVPALFWALLFVLVSLACATRSLQLFLRGRKEDKAYGR
ncbi:M50 family metallopeptidase [Cohnella hashimotonis]|uniref:M50 family metallopeptidase n=1 Tax=Cohnella hashimotonis TaxID=2826895 RepID=A0ABT6TKB2_9BACL|nr:M50 family metallopeptidase [Cohnella hashimotonis]MDI4647286.1 M50 family metallopeptidase [Cohnella hashimotonis]